MINSFPQRTQTYRAHLERQGKLLVIIVTFSFDHFRKYINCEKGLYICIAFSPIAFEMKYVNNNKMTRSFWMTSMLIRSSRAYSLFYFVWNKALSYLRPVFMYREYQYAQRYCSVILMKYNIYVDDTSVYSTKHC